MTDNRVVIERIKRKIEAHLPGSKEMRQKLLRIGVVLKRESVTAYHQSGKGTLKSLRVRTGTLINSMQYRISNRPGVANIRFGPWGIRYAAIHEFGGRAGRGLKVKIPARPYLRPTLERSRRYIMKILGEANGN